VRWGVIITLLLHCRSHTYNLGSDSWLVGVAAIFSEVCDCHWNFRRKEKGLDQFCVLEGDNGVTGVFLLPMFFVCGGYFFVLLEMCFGREKKKFRGEALRGDGGCGSEVFFFPVFFLCTSLLCLFHL